MCLEKDGRNQNISICMCVMKIFGLRFNVMAGHGKAVTRGSLTMFYSLEITVFYHV